MSATTTPYAEEKYLPERRREGVALCLSGGGFRATLFHLGVVRRLNELGVLAKLATVTSVSGGSIFAACLATGPAWPLAAPLSADQWTVRIARPIRDFTKKNRRTRPILTRLLPWNWLRESTGVEVLARIYEKELTAAKLRDLPLSPRFVLCATDLAFGVNWIFERGRMGDYQAGYIAPPPDDWPLARAVAASSCFPPIFNPLPVRIGAGRYKGGRFPRGTLRDDCLSDLRLTDGGNYDNLGLEPVWKDHAIVLVSDGGGTFDFAPDKGLRHRLLRYTAVVDNQARALRKRWLVSSFITGALEGTYWGIGSAPSTYGRADAPGYSSALAEQVIAQVRTDLDEFSDGEAAVLENHGYLLADAAIRRHAPRLLGSDVPPIAIPHLEWMDEARVRAALRDSARRRLL